MEIIQGKNTRQIGAEELALCMTGYHDVLLDLGTGDGRFVLQTAKSSPSMYVIGLDACRENLVEGSRNAPKNALFVIAGAENLPPELYGQASRLTINFPWGSMLRGLLEGGMGLLESLSQAAQPKAELEVRLNASALHEAGWELDPGAERVAEVLAASGFQLSKPLRLGPTDLRNTHTTWAKRLAFGRDPRAYAISGRKIHSQIPVFAGRQLAYAAD